MSDDQSLKLQQPPALEPPEVTPQDGFDPEDLIGQTLGGRYVVEQRVGKGGMGVVYLASQSALNRKVVVKVLAGSVSDDEEAITRFEREALGLSQLQHPNIVTIYDFGRDKDLAYIVMEYVDGDTLTKLIRRNQPVDFEEFAHVATQILDALAEAHSRGIIHRDIKPSNIMLCERRGHQNVVKVLDFGLAKLIHDSAEVTKKTNLVGSVAFLAPEQILGLEFDQRVDVYALGVLFYYVLSGQKPFRGEDDLSILYQHIHKDPTPLQDILPQGHNVPPEVINIVHMCLAKDPRERPENAREILTMFQVDMSRSVFQTPWASGEWQSASGAHLRTPSTQTPIPPSTNPNGHPTPYSDHSGQYSNPNLSYDESQTYPVQRSSNKIPIIGGVLLLIALAVGVGVVVKTQQSTSTVPSEHKSVETLDAVGKLVNDGKWGQAKALLASVQAHQGLSTELLKRRAKYDNAIAVGQLLMDAKVAEDAKDVDKARLIYTKILKLNPAHERAKTYLAALSTSSEKVVPPTTVSLPTLKVDSRIKAKVYLDNTFVGYTPSESQPKPGKYTVVVKARGYLDWRKSLTLTNGQKVVLDAELIGKGFAKKRPRKTKPAIKTPKTSPKKTTPKSDNIFKPDKKKSGGLLPVGN